MRTAVVRALGVAAIAGVVEVGLVWLGRTYGSTRVTQPWWLTTGGRLVVVPADVVMSRTMLRGVRSRAEGVEPAA